VDICQRKLQVTGSSNLYHSSYKTFKKEVDNWCARLYLFHEQYVTDAGAETVDATITDKRFNISDPEDMDNLHAILCVSTTNYEPNVMPCTAKTPTRSTFDMMLKKTHFLLVFDTAYMNFKIVIIII
jgi:hypothetical protein